MKKYLLSTLSIMLPYILAAQISISGCVTNLETNEPLAGAQVMIQPDSKTAITTADGRFVFTNLKTGNYQVMVSFIGFASEQKSVSLKESAVIAIALTPSSYPLEKIIVTATRANEKTPVSYQNMNKEAIKSQNFGKDISFLVSNTPSAVATSDAGTGIGYSYLRIRGTDQSRINVTVNGIPFNDAESHQVYWVNMPDFASNTNEIQIQRGVGTSTNGAAAFGASINMQTTQLQQKSYAEIASSAGSFNTFKNTVNFGTGLLHNHFTIDGRLSAISSNGYIDRATANLKSYFASAAYLKKNTFVRFNVFSGNEKTYMAWDGVPSNVLDTNRTFNGQGIYTDFYGNTKFYDKQTDNYTQTHYQLLLSQNLATNWTTNAALHYTKGFGYYEQYKDEQKLKNYGIASIQLPTDFYVIGNDTIRVADGLIKTADLVRRKYLDNDFYGFTFSSNYRLPKLDATVGGSYNIYDGNHFGEVIWCQFASNASPNHEWYRGSGLKKDFSVYSKLNYQFLENLNLYGDLQFRAINYSIAGIDDDLRDITQQHQYHFLNPKAGMLWNINSQNRAYASFAVAHREPTRDNFVDASPLKPIPKPEHLFDLELGHAFSSEKITLASTVYYMTYKNQLALTGAINDVGAAVMENVPNSYRLGLEVSAKTLLLNKIYWDLGFTVSRNKIKHFTEYVDNWETGEQTEQKHSQTDLAFSPSVIANNMITIPFHFGLTLVLNTKFVGKQHIDNTQSDARSLKAYSVSDFKALYSFNLKFIKNLEVIALINNVFNKKYESNAWVYRYYENEEYHTLDGYFPQAGINFMMGINVRF